MTDKKVIKDLTEKNKQLYTDACTAINELSRLREAIAAKDLGLMTYAERVVELEDEMTVLKDDNKAWRMAYMNEKTKDND